MTKLVILRDNGEIDIIRPADELAITALKFAWGIPVLGLVATPVAAQVLPAAGASSVLPQLAAGIGVTITVSLPLLQQVLTNNDPDDDSLNVGLGLEQHLQPWARDNGLTTYTDVYGPSFREDRFADLMNKADTIHFNMEGFSEKSFQKWVREGAALSFGGPLGSTVTNYEMHQILTNPAWLGKTTPHNGKLPKLPK